MDRNYNLLFVVTIFILIHHHTSLATDEAALLSLKSHISNNILARNWSSSVPVCSWIGITCSSRHHRVTALDISSMQLHGTIPPSIGNLSFLSSLDISNNTFHGDLPVELARLQRLKLIDVSDNNFTGPIPSFLSLLPNLHSLILLRNQFSGEIPSSLSNLTKLQELVLDRNFLEGEIPREIGDLRYLTILDLQFNQLSGSIPPSIFNITTMQVIALSGNNLTGMLPKTICDHIPDLEGLYLGRNSLDGVIPPNLEKCKKLQILELSENEFAGTVPRELANLTTLTELAMSALHLEGVIPMELANLKKLQALVLARNEFTGSVAESIFNISALQTTDFGQNKFSGNYAYWSLVIVRWMVFCLHLLATEGFNEANLLGNGSFSRVYKGILKDGIIIAAKVFDVQLEGAFKSFDTECEVLRNLRHRNLTKVITSCSNLDFKALVLEYMPNGTLDKWLYSHNLFLNLMQRLDIMIDVASAMDYLRNGYSMPVVHCDLKPSNVLLDEELVAHVSDFGIAKMLGAGEAFVQTRTIATIGYIATEYGQDGIVSTRCDVYSFGILMMETFTRTRPSDEIFTGDLSIQRWVNDSFPGEIHKVVDSNLVQPGDEQITAKMQCLLSIMGLALNCTLVRPDERISMKDALSTLKKMRFQLVSSRH